VQHGSEISFGGNAMVLSDAANRLRLGRTSGSSPSAFRCRETVEPFVLTVLDVVAGHDVAALGTSGRSWVSGRWGRHRRAYFGQRASRP